MTEENSQKVRILRTEARTLLGIGEEVIEIENYELLSFAGGITELNISIKGLSTTFEMLSNLK